MHKRHAHGIVGKHAERNGTIKRNNARRNGLLVPALRVAEPRPEASTRDILRTVADELGFCPKCGKDIQRFVLATIALAKHEQPH